MIASVVRANKKYYLQTLLEECRYVQEKINTENYIDEDLEKSELERATLTMRRNLILIMMNNLLKVF